jgi:hypothetical protein
MTCSRVGKGLFVLKYISFDGRGFQMEDALNHLVTCQLLVREKYNHSHLHTFTICALKQSHNLLIISHSPNSTMASTPIRSVLITGGNGVLGSHTAFKIVASQLEVFLILTARRPNDSNAQAVSEEMRSMGVESFEFFVVDLSSFSSVRKFASTIEQRVQAGKIPPIEIIINSAAYSSYVMDARTGDDFDPVLQTNVLSPFLLSVLLLGTSFAKDGNAPNGKVIDVTSETVGIGSL